MQRSQLIRSREPLAAAAGIASAALFAAAASIAICPAVASLSSARDLDGIFD